MGLSVLISRKRGESEPWVTMVSTATILPLSGGTTGNSLPSCFQGRPKSPRHPVARVVPLESGSHLVSSMMGDVMSGVLLPWVAEMSWKCQSILQGGFRGPDVGPGNDATKKVNRWLRTVSQHNADTSKQYMRNDGLPDEYDLCAELEYMTCHYVHHLADAIRCVAIWHPDEEVKKVASMYHYRIAEELFHFMPETCLRFIERHVDKVEHS